MLRKLLVGSALVAVAAACSDSTGPEDFNAPALQQQADQLLAALTNNEALLALTALDSASAPFAAARTAVALLPGSPTDPSAPLRLRRLGQSLLSFGSASPLALFPVDLIGTTFVYNSDSAKYVIDAARTDGPTDGIRLVLYAVNPISHVPVVPLQEVGNLDLHDVSTPTSDAIRIVATVGSVTYVDYTASAALGTSSATLGAAGFLSNGTDEVNFNLSWTFTSTSITVDYLLEAGNNSIRLLDVLTGSGTTSVENVTVTIKDATNTVVLHVTVTSTTTSQSWTGDIRYNGAVAVTIGGTPNAPTFTRWDGTALTAAEIQALGSVVDSISTVFTEMSVLLGPALMVLALGNA
jgi:hypothetical protein